MHQIFVHYAVPPIHVEVDLSLDPDLDLGDPGLGDLDIYDLEATR